MCLNLIFMNLPIFYIWVLGIFLLFYIKCFYINPLWNLYNKYVSSFLYFVLYTIYLWQCWSHEVELTCSLLKYVKLYKCYYLKAHAHCISLSHSRFVNINLYTTRGPVHKFMLSRVQPAHPDGGCWWLRWQRRRDCGRLVASPAPPIGGW